MNDHQLSGDLAPIDIALRLTRTSLIDDIRWQLQRAGIVRAVALYDTSVIFDWIVSVLPLQGISDRAATSYQAEHGGITWADVEEGLGRHKCCPSLRSWWHFRCGYRKSVRTCANPDFIDFCSLPAHDLRKGALNESAYGLFLFLRDVCDGDLIAWIDRRLAHADVGDAIVRGRRMAAAVVDPLTEIPGTGPKLWSMILADLLLGADSARERWVSAGASMIAIDTLVHAWLHRTGTQRRLGREHRYGPNCHRSGGCVEVIERIAETIDASVYDSVFPIFSPRFVQVAIWQFCAADVRNICNGRQIDDRYPCRQIFCPAGAGCARLALHP